jgi:hypothetical protein
LEQFVAARRYGKPRLEPDELELDELELDELEPDEKGATAWLA